MFSTKQKYIPIFKPKDYEKKELGFRNYHTSIAKKMGL